MRSLLLALALARAVALLDSPGDSPGHSPGLRGTTISEAEPAGQYGNACSTTATAQQCLDATGGHNAQKGPCNY